MHEEPGQGHHQQRAHGDADDLVAELHGAIGAQPPAGGAVLLHVAPSLVAMAKDGRAEQSHPGSRNPSAAMMKTDITNALEIGLKSEMPSAMPLTSTKTKQRAIATSRKNTG
jgi:hypothetical protein